jgi:hypothetical protein
MVKVQDGEFAELPPFGPTANTVWGLNAWGFSSRTGHVFDGDSLRRQFRLTHEHASDFETSRRHTHKFTHKGTRPPGRCRLFREERLSEAMPEGRGAIRACISTARWAVAGLLPLPGRPAVLSSSLPPCQL